MRPCERGLSSPGIGRRAGREGSIVSWRERKGHDGEMVQMDGSHHDWLEGRGRRCVLMGYIDDATGRGFGRFYEYEGTVPAMDSFRQYIQRHGIPLSVYLDKHTTYKSLAKPSIEEQLEGVRPLSEFERALKELGVESDPCPFSSGQREGWSGSLGRCRTGWSRRCV